MKRTADRFAGLLNDGTEWMPPVLMRGELVMRSKPFARSQAEIESLHPIPCSDTSGKERVG
jgi:hypothetical protein